MSSNVEYKRVGGDSDPQTNVSTNFIIIFVDDGSDP